MHVPVSARPYTTNSPAAVHLKTGSLPSLGDIELVSKHSRGRAEASSSALSHNLCISPSSVVSRGIAPQTSLIPEALEETIASQTAGPTHPPAHLWFDGPEDRPGQHRVNKLLCLLG